MKRLPIITIPNPILKQKTKTIARFDDPKFQCFIDEMIDTMYESNGWGLAAPQVSQPIKLITIVPEPEKFEQYKNESREGLVLINPVIKKHSWLTKKEEEGCLSIPNIFGQVKRWRSITVHYKDRKGKNQEIKASKLLARVLQHEIDHLDGVLFIDRAEKLYRYTQM